MALPLACHLLILGHRDVSIVEQDGCVFMALRYSYCHPYAFPLVREEREARSRNHRSGGSRPESALPTAQNTVYLSVVIIKIGSFRFWCKYVVIFA